MSAIDVSSVVSEISNYIIPVSAVGISVLLIYSVIRAIEHVKELILPKSSLSSSIPPPPSHENDLSWDEMMAHGQSERELQEAERFSNAPEGNDLAWDEMMAHGQSERELQEAERFSNAPMTAAEMESAAWERHEELKNEGFVNTLPASTGHKFF